MDVEFGRMLSVLLLLLTGPFGLVTSDSIPSSNCCNASHKVHAKRTLFTTKQEIDPSWSHRTEPSVTQQEQFVKSGSLTRKITSFTEDFDKKSEIQDAERIQNNDDKRVGVNAKDLGSDESVRDFVALNKRKAETQEKEKSCHIYLKGDLYSNAAMFDITCSTDSTRPGRPTNISDFTDRRSIPDTKEYGFTLFEQVDGKIYAIHVNQSANLILSSVNICNFRGLGSIFLVENATLDIRSGIIYDTFEAQDSGVMSVSDSTVDITNCEFKNTHGKHAGVATISNSNFTLNSSYFEDNFGLEESLVFFASDTSNVTLFNDTFVGTLPQTDDESALISSTMPARENFKVVEARAGVVYLTNSSSLTMLSSRLMHVGSLKGLIYLEKNSSLLCRDSELVHNIAIYGGAIFAQDSHVEVTNVYAERNAASRGGTILFRGSCTGHLDSVVFKSNLASEGGAFYIEYDDCKQFDKQFVMSLKNCSFIGNRAYYEGGAVFASCVSLDITRSTFTKNTAWLGGGGIFANTSVDVKLKSVSFIGNVAQEGGAISVHAEITHGNMTVEKGAFEDNRADRGSGGAIMYYGSYSTLISSLNNFSRNEAAEDGGALYASQTQTLNSSRDIFEDNIARNGSGGAVNVFRNIALSLEAVTMKGSSASDDGGGLYVYKSKSFKLQSSYITQNKANKGDGGGIALFCVGNITIFLTTVNSFDSARSISSMCKVHGNVAGSSGGGVSYKTPLYIPDDERKGTFLGVDLLRVIFRSNQANDGGGFFVHSIDTLTVIRSLFVENQAILDGGGVLVDNVTTVNLEVTHMHGNKAQNGSGGALYGYLYGGALCLLKTPILIVEGTMFRENKVTAHSGGAVALFDDTKITVQYTKFHSNTARRSGGALFAMQPNQAEFKQSQFESNIARTEDGGGICFRFIDQKYNATGYNASQFVNTTTEESVTPSVDRPESILMSNITFESNEAGRHGGGLYLNKLRGTLTLDTKPTFKDCKANGGSGGCAYLANIEALLVERVLFDNNTAYWNGGCFFLTNIPTVDLNESRFTSCGVTKGKGGAVYYLGDPETKNTLMMSTLITKSCRAAEGGAFHTSNVEVLCLDGSQLLECKAHSGSGGCLVANNVMEVYLRTVTVAYSEASESCGGICLTSVAYVVLEGTLHDNDARLHGGAAWLRDVTKAIISESYTESISYRSYSKNTAGGFGGALFLTNVRETDIHAVQFEGNKAGEDGGAVSVYSVSFMNFIGSKFSRNEARDGGGLHIGISDHENASLVKVTECQFRDNKARVNGGGVSTNKRYATSVNSIPPGQSSPVSIEVSHCSFTHNKADNGGGMEIAAGDVSVEYNTFIQNEASGSGGALYISDPHFLLINNASIRRNTADKGGALSVGCDANLKLNDAVIRRNSAPKRDDGGLVACKRANITMSNVRFYHNFRDQKWYFYVLFPLCSYILLLAFLLIGVFVLQRSFQRKKSTVTYDTYSDIGEYDPSATDLTSFLAEPAAEVETDDEGIVAPKPSPMDPGAKSGYAISHSLGRGNETEISEGSEEDAPVPQHRYPPRV